MISHKKKQQKNIYYLVYENGVNCICLVTDQVHETWNSGFENASTAMEKSV